MPRQSRERIKVMENKNMATNYEQFLTLLTECLQKKLGRGYQFFPQKILKTNEVVKHSLTITSGDSNIAPSICMDAFYLDYASHNMKLDYIAEAVLQIYKQNKADCPIDASLFTDWSQIRGTIRCRLVNTEKNKHLLSEMPHREVLDLSIVYYLQVKVSGSAEGTIHIRNEHMKFWHTDEASLYTEAWKNMHAAGDADISSIMDIIASVLDMPQPHTAPVLDSQMYVLTNRNRLYGAVHMADLQKMAEIADKMNTDLWILPSSIHEVILIPGILKNNAAELAQMVCEINKTELSAGEILSCHVYYFSRNTGKISIAA